MSWKNDLKAEYQFGGMEQKLIFWNVGAFIVSIPFYYQFSLGIFEFPLWIKLSANIAQLAMHPWTLVSYGFFHASFFHLFFNMMVLNFSGKLFQTFFTQKQLLGVYVLGLLVSGLGFVLAFSFFNLGLSTGLVGASGAIMAVLAATATYAPTMNIRLLLIGNVKLWQITLVILGIDLMQLFIENTGGHIAHLSGALFGFVYIKLLQQGIDLSKIISGFFDTLAQLFGSKKKNTFKKVHRTYQKPLPKQATKVVIKDKTQQQIDDILDKISQSGYDSLSSDEKEFLFKAGK
jgi:membrane associated rhomboid family serine protease